MLGDEPALLWDVNKDDPCSYLGHTPWGLEAGGCMVVFELEMWALRCVFLGSPPLSPPNPFRVCAPVFWGLDVEMQGLSLSLFVGLVGAAGG